MCCGVQWLIYSGVYLVVVFYFIMSNCFPCRRYINDCRVASAYNVSFDKRPQDKCALVVALRDIEVCIVVYVLFIPQASTVLVDNQDS